jgi:hypothetical protein
MTDITALKALAEAVEAGKFSRDEGELPRYSAFFDACQDAGVKSGAKAMEALHGGTAGDFIRALIAQAEKGEG